MGGFCGFMLSMPVTKPSSDLKSQSRPEFDDFFRAQLPRLGKALFLLTGDRTEAEDLAQEAFARTFERWPRVSSMASPDGYLYRVAMNLYRRRFRRRAPWHAPPPPPEDPAVTATSRAEIHRALHAVTKEQREALVLVEWLGFDTTEAGNLLGIDAGSVRSRLHRAREELRKQLGGRDE